MNPRTSSRSAVLVSLLVAVIVFVVTAATMRDVGLTWDEPAYMGSARSYAMWFSVLGRSVLQLHPAAAFSSETIERYWDTGQNDVHPPLGKVLPALTWRFLRGALGDVTAMRMGNAIIFAALAGLLCLVGSQMAGVVAGVFAAASLVLMPRLFFHGHLTALDIPVAFAWLLTVYIFWRWTAAQRPRPWLTVLLLGLSYGLALGTKNTSFVLPLVFLLWVLLFRRTRQAFLLLFGMLLIGALVFFVTWPWLYVDPVGHLREYLQLVTVGHWDISQYYLGQLYARAPWHYPFVILIATVPVAITLIGLLGIIRVVVAGRTDAGGWVVIMNVAIPLLFFAFVASQAYGGERLFLVVFPFVALLAGLGFDCLWEEITGLEGRRRVTATVLAILLLMPGLAGIILMHPYQLSYFSEIVGGLKGAERLGFELTYWCETYDGMLSYLNNVPETSPSVWTEEDGVLYAYQNEGLLRPDIQVGGRVVTAGPLAATYALIQRRPSGYTPEIESILRDRQPVLVVRQGDTPLAYLYKIQ